jgi:TonB family protein
MFRVLFNHILPFVLGCFFGVAAFYLVMPVDVPVPLNASGSGWGSGSGSGYCRSGKSVRLTAGSATFEPSATSPFVITSKPRATYTDLARQNNTEGAVLLKVTLLASGEVGNVSVVRGLPDGLTEQAVEAARQIEFEPKKVNGVPVSVTQTFEYTFEVY